MFRFLVVAVLLLPWCSGCSTVPQELAGLGPVTITVRDGDRPVGDVVVLLFEKEPRTLRTCSGVTDASGVARIASSARNVSRPGVAAGTYKVVLKSNVRLPAELQMSSDQEDLLPEKERSALHAKRKEFMEKHGVVPKILDSAAKTPIELAVAEKDGATLSVDIGKYR